MYFFNNNYEDGDHKMAAAPAASCISTEHGCVMFDCLVHLWEWLDPPASQNDFPMENKKPAPATQQPVTQQHLMAQHVHPDQIYSPQHPQITSYINTAPANQIQPNGVMHQLLQSQYQSNMNARSPLLENRHELYGTGHNHEYTRHYGTNDNYNNYPQSPTRVERTDLQPDQNVNHEIMHTVPKGYNAEVYHDYLKRNPPKDSNQIYQNHQPMYRPNVNQYGSKPYLPYSNRIGPQSNTELLRRQYNEIQQMKMQQQLHYQNQAQMHQQQKFAERQLLLQQIHGVQPPPNLQNSIYSDSSYRDLDRYSSKHDFKDYSMTDMQKDVDRYAKNNEYKEMERQNRQYQETQWQLNQAADAREIERYRKQLDEDKAKSQSPPSDFSNQSQKNNMSIASPMKSSESSTPSIKSPSSESRRSSGGNQALRSPIAQRIPSAPVTIAGILYKQGSDGLKVWRKRWFVLSEYCLFYYKSQDEQKLLGSVLLPSYVVSACTAEDKVMRKFAFKLEHANMRTYVLAALDQEAMLKWVKSLTMAALMQNSNDYSQKPNERSAAKTEDSDEIPGPTYANAPPKPRRSNDGYSSPSPDMYDPNYDLLKKPASHYSQGTNHTRYQDHMNYPSSTNQESTYTRSPQSPPLQQSQYQTKRPYDTQHLSLPLTNTNTENLGNNQPSTSSMYRSNPQSPYFDNRNRNQHQQKAASENSKEQVYDRQPQRNPFLQDYSTPTDPSPKNNDLQQNKNNRQPVEQAKDKSNYNESYPESRTNANNHVEQDGYNKDVYGELNVRPNRTPNTSNERTAERRTPDAYGRSPSMSAYSKGKLGDYEDIYAAYSADNDNVKAYPKSPNPSQSRDNISLSSQKQQDQAVNHVPEKTFSGPSVLRRKKMQSSGIQPPMPRPHSADFLEYESKNEEVNKTIPVRAIDPPKQPQRPKSSLDINSYYDPSSDRYYSEESYAEKMRQSALYLHRQATGPRNIQIPLEKYASGLAEKQLNSPYAQTTNNNYETEFNLRNHRDNISYNSKYSDVEGLNSNWTLKEKALEAHKDLNRSGSVMSDNSNISAYVKEMNRTEQHADGFMRSASARLPSTTTEKEGEKKVQQREESMKRLLEWKQRMLQSPLTRKSTPATISLARSLNHSRQSLRSDQYKSKTYTNASYNSYSSDDEEETSDTDLQKPRDMQAGRSHNMNIASPIVMRPTAPHAHCVAQLIEQTNVTHNTDEKLVAPIDNTYENVLCTVSISKLISGEVIDCDNSECNQDELSSKSIGEIESEEKPAIASDGYETHDSEAESETQIEYTDNDLDEVLLQSENENEDSVKNYNTEVRDVQVIQNCIGQKTDKTEESSETPPLRPLGEDHYLPMSPRKTSTIEPAHKTILQNLSVFDDSLPHHYEDNPYVEMNLGNDDEEDMQTYEVVCVNNGKIEPVYMELNNIFDKDDKDADDVIGKAKFPDTVINFAETKDQTVKRASKNDKFSRDKLDSDADDECLKDTSLVDAPFSRFSISDTFRPASYYLGGSQTILERQDSSDSDIVPPPPIPSSSPPVHELSDEALSKYILEKLDKSDISQDNSILKMLTSENQKMNSSKRRTTSLMIYGSRTSIHDTLTRGEKVRNSRASLVNDKYKFNNSSHHFINDSVQDQQNCSSIESGSLGSFNAERGSSRLSIESDLSSKFEITASNISSDIISLRDCESFVDLRHSNFRDLENIIKRRPLSDDSIFELSESQISNEEGINRDITGYLELSQPSTSEVIANNNYENTNISIPSGANFIQKDNSSRNYTRIDDHARCSSSPNNNTFNCGTLENKRNTVPPISKINDQICTYLGSQRSCSPVGIAGSPISFYSKNNEGTLLRKNLNNEVMADKIKEFENDKPALKTGTETNISSSTTGFHSRESSTEHSAPYYYSDLSSQEHINVLPTSHFLKNTNLHRKLNNQRRRGPLHKKNEISHIHNPIRNNQVLMSDRSYEFTNSARSVSVEFLSAAEKDPDIDLKNIYESSGVKNSKIPESMNLISGLGCKRNCNLNNNGGNSSSDSNSFSRSNLNVSSTMKVSSGSMSSHCSGNSSNTVYYDAEAEASAYENVICPGEKHWDEDALWRDNLRRVSHRHARSMDDLDARPVDVPTSDRITGISCMNSIKRIKKNVPTKISRNPTYVNCDIQSEAQRRRESNLNYHSVTEESEKIDENDVYVSLANTIDTAHEQTDEGVYEQLTIESSNSSIVMDPNSTLQRKKESDRKRFEIDREKLRQWDLMSSGLMKGGTGCVRGLAKAMGTSDALCSTDTGTDSASNEASMSMSGTNIEPATNNNTQNQQSLSKKAFLGSNTSIGRSNRDGNIPVRAVSPRVRWVEDKSNNDHYATQQIMTSQQNLHALTTNDEAWVRSPSRAMQQPIRAVSPRVRKNTESEDMPRETQQSGQENLEEVPTAGELLGRSHEELVLLLIQLRRRHAATHRSIEQCCAQINSIEDCLSSLKAMEREESLQRLEQLKMQLMDLEHQYEKSKPLVQLVDNMVKLGSLYNRPGSTVERLERNQRLRQKVLAEHALEQQRWLESAAAGKPLETEAARARVAELWALEQELADEAAILQGLKTDKDAIESLLTGVRGKLDSVNRSELRQTRSSGYGLEAELARVHAMLAHNSKKLEQTVADNARLERELQQLRRALQARRAAVPAHPSHSAHPGHPGHPGHPAHATAMLEDVTSNDGGWTNSSVVVKETAGHTGLQSPDEVSRVQQLVSALQRQRQELSRAVRHLTQQSHALQISHDSMPGKRRPTSSWQETNLDTGHTIDHGHSDYDYDMSGQVLPPGHYGQSNVETPLYVDTRGTGTDITSPLTSEDLQHSAFGNLSNVEKQEIKTVRIVKRESERRQRDRERSLQPMSDWTTNNITANLDQFLEEELVQPISYARASSVPRTDFSKFEEYYTRPQPPENPTYIRLNDKNMELSPKYPSSPSLSNYDYSRDISSLSSSYHKSYDRSGYDRSISISNQYLNSPTDSARTLTNDPISKTSSIASLSRSHMELSPIFKSEAAKQIITEMSGEGPKNGSMHRRQVPKEKRRHYTAPHHLSAKTLNEIPKENYNQDALGRSLDDADMERALRGAAPDVVRSALPRRPDSIDQLLAAPQKILIPERYIPEKPPELSPEEQQKRQEKVESIKKMLTGSSADPSKSPDGEEKRQREHLLQMNQILAKQVTEMSKIIAVKALEELPKHDNSEDYDDRSPDVELPIYQQRDNFFT